MSAVEAQAIAAWTSASLSLATVPAAFVAAWLLELGGQLAYCCPSRQDKTWQGNVLQSERESQREKERRKQRASQDGQCCDVMAGEEALSARLRGLRLLGE